MRKTVGESRGVEFGGSADGRKEDTMGPRRIGRSSFLFGRAWPCLPRKNLVRSMGAERYSSVSRSRRGDSDDEADCDTDPSNSGPTPGERHRLQWGWRKTEVGMAA